MSRIGITYEDVAKAIPTLQGQQKNLTVDNVRGLLGTGSKSTIARLLREWKAKHGLHPDDEGKLPSDLLNFVNGLWLKIQEKADLQTQEYQHECDEKVSQLQQQLNQHQRLQAEEQKKIHALEEQLHQCVEKNKQLTSTLIIEQQEKLNNHRLKSMG